MHSIIVPICILLLSHRTSPQAEIEHIPIEKALALGHGCKNFKKSVWEAMLTKTDHKSLFAIAIGDLANTFLQTERLFL